MKICLLSGVRSCYDEGKRVAETLMFDYHRQHGIGMHILSPSLSLTLVINCIFVSVNLTCVLLNRD